jgi:hypothetical protein
VVSFWESGLWGQADENLPSVSQSHNIFKQMSELPRRLHEPQAGQSEAHTANAESGARTAVAVVNSSRCSSHGSSGYSGLVECCV